MRYIFLFIILFLNVSCTQNLLSNIRITNEDNNLLSLEQILVESGLIYPSNISNKNFVTNMDYDTGVLIPDSLVFETVYYTIQVKPNSEFEIISNIKTYLTAVPYFSSEGIIYQADKSHTPQGKFNFLIADKSGQIKIRLYTPDGILKIEETWYIEFSL